MVSCPGCGSPVPPTRGKTPRRWCAARCKNRAAMRAWRARQRALHGPKKHYCAAYGCTKRFIRKPHTRKIFCSRQCQERANKRARRALAKARKAAAA